MEYCTTVLRTKYQAEKMRLEKLSFRAFGSAVAKACAIFLRDE